jgi:multidrug efflux system membrane fusion protein
VGAYFEGVKLEIVATSARALVLLAFVGTACGDPKGAPKGGAAPAIVSVAQVREADVPFEVPAFGLVEASSTVDIVPQVTGLVTEVHFKEGDFVKKGELLFTVDTRPYNASLAVAQAELARNEALAEQARVEAERAVRLAAEGIASEQEVAKARADAASTAASVKVGRATLRSAGLNVSFTRITAPIDGRTGSLLIHPGNVVHAGATQPLVVIRAVSPVQVRFSVPEEYLARIRSRMASSPLSVRITPKGESAKSVEAPLTFVENSVDTRTGTLGLKATFANENLELWPGASVDVALILDEDKGAVIVPEAAIQVGQDGKHVFVVEGAKAKLRRVEVARSSEHIALIRSGVRVGEHVVIEGQVRLRDGVSVSVKPSGPDSRAKKPEAGPEAALQ